MKFTYRGGAIELSDSDFDEARLMEQQLFKMRQIEVIKSGELLLQIRDRKLYLYLNQDFMEGDSTDHDADTSFHLWCERRLGMSKSDAYRRINIYRYLYLNHEGIFDEFEKLPDIKRLDYLSSRSRWEHPKIEEILIASGDLDNKEWRATVKIEFGGMGESEAVEAVERDLRRIRQHIAQREHVVKSKRFDSPRFRKFVCTFPCAVTGEYKVGAMEPAHLKSKGAGGDDFCNIVPLMHEVHRYQHDHGWDAFEREYGVELEVLKERAIEYILEWLVYSEVNLEWSDAFLEKASIYNPKRKGR
jgi:hypothetical protein